MFLCKITGIVPTTRWTESLENKVRDCLSIYCRKSMVVKIKDASKIPFEIDLFKADLRKLGCPGKHVFDPLISSNDLVLYG